MAITDPKNLRQRLEDWQDDYREAIKESRHDEKHCACVPLLRIKISRADELLEEAMLLAQSAPPASIEWINDYYLFIEKYIKYKEDKI